ncbi:MAG: HEAT repeat domain-containing protein [Gemmataceae bacterium]
MRTLLLAVCLGVVGGPLQAGSLFPWRKAEKVDPKVRVPQLLQILQTDKDEFKRSDAIVELRQYDPAAFPDMIPALITVLFTDPRPGVRIDAAQTLSKLRPVNSTVGEALEQAMEKDASMRVRLQARSALLNYQWAGYRSVKKPQGTVVSPVPKPVSPPTPTTEKRTGWGSLFLPALRTAPPLIPTPRLGTTPEPPLAAPPLANPPVIEPSTGGPALPTAASTGFLRPKTPPPPLEEGPILP